MTRIWDYGDDSGAKDPSNCNSSSWELHVLWPPQAHVCTWYTVAHTGACIHINSNNRSKKLSAINSFPLLLPSVSWVLAMPSNPGLLADPLPSQTGSHTVTACEEHCQAQHRIFLFVSRLTEALEHKRGLSFVHGPVFSIQNNARQWQLLSYACQSLQKSHSLFHHSLKSDLVHRDKPFVVLFTLSSFTHFMEFIGFCSALFLNESNPLLDYSNVRVQPLCFPGLCFLNKHRQRWRYQ